MTNRIERRKSERATCWAHPPELKHVTTLTKPLWDFIVRYDASGLRRTRGGDQVPETGSGFQYWNCWCHCKLLQYWIKFQLLLQIPSLLFTLLQCVANVSYVLIQQLVLSVASGLVITPVIFFRPSDIFLFLFFAQTRCPTLLMSFIGFSSVCLSLPCSPLSPSPWPPSVSSCKFSYLHSCDKK